MQAPLSQGLHSSLVRACKCSNYFILDILTFIGYFLNSFIIYTKARQTSCIYVQIKYEKLP